MKLIVRNLSKTYKNGVKAIDHMNIEIGTGMFGLLGPNGAGKSTLMRTIATLQSPDSGSIEFRGIDIFQHQLTLRKMLGYLPQSFGVYPKMTAEKLLEYFALLKGLSSATQRKKRIDELLNITNLYDVRKNHVASYSGGMKQRFGIAQMLLNNPKLIIVDEPTAGLDPAERHRFLNILREIGTNSTVIFSTHIVEDVKDLCNDMAILKGGRILKTTTPENAIQEFKGKIWTKVIRRSQLDDYESLYNVLSANYNKDNSLSIRVFALEKPASDFDIAEPELDDVYFITLKEDKTLIA